MTDDESTRVIATKHSSASATPGKCKCGSSEHWYTNHHLCLVNKKKQASVESDTSSDQVPSNSETEEEIAHLFCNSGSGKATHSHSCLFNPRNYVHCTQFWKVTVCVYLRAS